MKLRIQTVIIGFTTIVTIFLCLSPKVMQGETEALIAPGWRPGEYLCVGPDSLMPHGDFPNQTLYYTDDYGQHLQELHTDIFAIRTDAQDGCCYGNFLPDQGFYEGRSCDGGRTWEEIELAPYTTGRVPGEAYALGRVDSIRYSDNYCDSYQSFLSEGLNPNGLLVGHQDGEIYCTGYDLKRSEDYGRHFSLVYENQNDDSIGFSNHNWLVRGVLDGELYLFDEACFRVFRSTDRGQSWSMQSDLEYPEYAEDRYFYWDIKAGVDSGEVVIYGFAFNYYGGGTIKFLVSQDYGQSFEEYTPFDYPPTGISSNNTNIPSLYGIEAFPNPFNSQCAIEVDLFVPQTINLSIIDMNGRLLDNVARGYYHQGNYRFVWPPVGAFSLYPNGCYYAVLKGDNGVSISRLVMMK